MGRSDVVGKMVRDSLEEISWETRLEGWEGRDSRMGMSSLKRSGKTRSKKKSKWETKSWSCLKGKIDSWKITSLEMKTVLIERLSNFYPLYLGR